MKKMNKVQQAEQALAEAKREEKLQLEQSWKNKKS
jgi:hypothetical protein